MTVAILFAAVLLALFSLVTAKTLTTEIPKPVLVAEQHPLLTPTPATAEWTPTRTIKRRDILSDITGGVNSILSDLGSNIPSFVASGIPNFFQDFPTGDNVQSSLGLDDDQVRALPTQVLNIP